MDLENLINVVASVVGGIFAYLAAHRSRQVNDAVNHRHEKRGEGAMKLYDLAWENHKATDELISWKRSYEGGPLDKGDKVREFCQQTEERLKQIETKMEGNE